MAILNRLDGVYTGVLHRIGTGTVFNGSLTKTSILEIGSHNLKDVIYDNFIDSYLSEALKSDQPITIMVLSSKIFAIRLNDKDYYSDSMPKKNITVGDWIAIVVMGLLTMGIVGVFLFFLQYKETSKAREVINEFELSKA